MYNPRFYSRPPRLVPHEILPGGWEEVTNSVTGVVSYLDKTGSPPCSTWLDPRYGYESLSPEWEEMTDPDTQRNYFLHKTAGSTLHDDPRLGELPAGWELQHMEDAIFNADSCHVICAISTLIRAVFMSNAALLVPFSCLTLLYWCRFHV